MKQNAVVTGQFMPSHEIGAEGDITMVNIAHAINKGLLVLGIASVFGALAAAVQLIVTIGQAAIG